MWSRAAGSLGTAAERIPFVWAAASAHTFDSEKYQIKPVSLFNSSCTDIRYLRSPFLKENVKHIREITVFLEVTPCNAENIL
jgi:hypothetical protein